MNDDNLINYIMKITEPFDYTLDNKNDNQEINIIVEPLKEKQLEPKFPEHADGDQHLNFGLDFFSAIDVTSEEVNPYYHYGIIRTGVKLQLPYGYHVMIGSRSGLGFKKHIQAFPGIIDHSYRGEIMIKLYCPNPFSIKSGEKVAQGIVLRSSNYTIVPGIVETDTSRGDNGFGSTDRQE